MTTDIATATAQSSRVDETARLPGELKPGDKVQPATKTGSSKRIWTVLGRVTPGRDSWFVRYENGLRSCVSGSDLRLLSAVEDVRAETAL
jgi:hypothetical protein